MSFPRRCLPVALLVLLSAVPGDLLAQNQEFKKRADEIIKQADANRASVARDILQQNAKRREQLGIRLREVETWTKTQFELGERGAIDKPTVMAPLLDRWQTQREKELYRLLQFRDKSVGGIESGKALNTLLDRIGSAAQENAQARKLNPEYGVPLYGPTADQLINEDTLRRLGWQDNTLGAKASGRFNEDPIDLQWPTVLLDERWAEQRHAIEESRERLLTELKAKRGVPPALDEVLRKNVGDLNKSYADYRQEWISNPPAERGSRAEEYRRLCNGSKYIERLVASVYQVVEATSISDVAPAEKFSGGNIEDLLAYMNRNNLRFSTPTKNTDRKAYYQVFDLMVRYYLDLKAVTNAEREIEQEIGRLDRIDETAVRDALRTNVTVKLVGDDDRSLLEALNTQ